MDRQEKNKGNQRYIEVKQSMKGSGTEVLGNNIYERKKAVK